MGSGGFFGVGLGNGIAKIFYLPEAPTDMMLANIGEELGLLGVTCVILAYTTTGMPACGSRSPAATRSASGSPSG